MSKQKEDGWIKCAARLPEPGCYIIFFKSCYCPVREAHWDGKQWRLMCWAYNNYPVKADLVTHWRDLPEWPERREEE